MVDSSSKNSVQYRLESRQSGIEVTLYVFVVYFAFHRRTWYEESAWGFDAGRRFVGKTARTYMGSWHLTAGNPNLTLRQSTVCSGRSIVPVERSNHEIYTASREQVLEVQTRR